MITLQIVLKKIKKMFIISNQNYHSKRSGYAGEPHYPSLYLIRVAKPSKMFSPSCRENTANTAAKTYLAAKWLLAKITLWFSGTGLCNHDSEKRLLASLSPK